jgi:hypothetical protein
MTGRGLPLRPQRAGASTDRGISDLFLKTRFHRDVEKVSLNPAFSGSVSLGHAKLGQLSTRHPGLAKRNPRPGLNNDAIMPDAKQTDFCAYKAAIVLLGLTVHAVSGIAW